MIPIINSINHPTWPQTQGTIRHRKTIPVHSMSTLPKGDAVRKSDHPVEPLFLRRWSPRAMSGEPLSEAEILRLFEAARWAPSTYNEQEWRFLYARRATPQWQE